MRSAWAISPRGGRHGHCETRGRHTRGRGPGSATPRGGGLSISAEGERSRTLSPRRATCALLEVEQHHVARGAQRDVAGQQLEGESKAGGSSSSHGSSRALPSRKGPSKRPQTHGELSLFSHATPPLLEALRASERSAEERGEAREEEGGARWQLSPLTPLTLHSPLAFQGLASSLTREKRYTHRTALASRSGSPVLAARYATSGAVTGRRLIHTIERGATCVGRTCGGE